MGCFIFMKRFPKKFKKKKKFKTNDRVDHSTAGMRLCNEKRWILFYITICYCRTSFWTNGLL